MGGDFNLPGKFLNAGKFRLIRIMRGGIKKEIFQLLKVNRILSKWKKEEKIEGGKSFKAVKRV